MPEQGERREARLQQRRTGPANARDGRSPPSASAAIDQMTGLPVQVFRSVVGFATHRASSGQTTGRGPEAPDGRRRDRRAGPPTTATAATSGRTGSAANGDEQPQRHRRIEDVAGPDLVRTGELVRLEERAAGQPAGA